MSPLVVWRQVVIRPPLRRERPPKVAIQRSPVVGLRTHPVTTRWARPSAVVQTRATFPPRISASPFSVQAHTASRSQVTERTFIDGRPSAVPIVSQRSYTTPPAGGRSRAGADR